MDHASNPGSRDYRSRESNPNPRTRSHSHSRSRSPDRRRHHHHHHHHHSRHKGHSHSRHDEKHSRSRDHTHSHKHDQKHSHSHSHAHDHQPKPLPFQARQLSKRDLPIYQPALAMYLDIQKGLWIDDLNEEEVKGRWKSFVSKWNRGELAEGWYDPGILKKARDAQDQDQDQDQDQGQSQSQDHGRGTGRAPQNTRGRRASPEYGEGEGEEEEEDDEEDYGPDLPYHYKPPVNRSGPSIPTTQDLELRKESAMEDTIAARQETRDQRRAELHSHKSTMRNIEDEVAPKAEPGTHERRMEKRQDAAAANRTFAESRRGASPGEGAPDEELMGSGENDLTELKKTQEKEQRKKNDREIRREEILRARTAEREERVRQYRQREEDTIGWLKVLAKQKYG